MTNEGLHEARLTDRADWLRDRARGIGGSEIPSLLGICPFGGTPLKVWIDKRAWIDDPDGMYEHALTEREREIFYWGRVLEPAIAQRFQEETNRMVKPGWNTIHPSVPQARGSMDFVQQDREKGLGVMDCKNHNRFRANEWDGGAPVSVEAQVQWYIGVENAYRLREQLPPMTFGSAAALLGGNEFRWYDFEYNPEFFARALQVVVGFWRRVESCEQPAAQGADLDALKALYPKDDGKTIDLPIEALEFDRRLADAKAAGSVADRQARDAKASIIQMMGSATWGRLLGGGIFQLRVEPRSGHVVQESRPRVLRRMK
jgi:predicted phage-related endonuclease